MDADAQLIGKLLRLLVLAVALWVAIDALDLQGPDPEVPRHVLEVPSEDELGPKGCGAFC